MVKISRKIAVFKLIFVFLKIILLGRIYGIYRKTESNHERHEEPRKEIGLEPQRTPRTRSGIAGAFWTLLPVQNRPDCSTRTSVHPPSPDQSVLRPGDSCWRLLSFGVLGNFGGILKKVFKYTGI